MSLSALSQQILGLTMDKDWKIRCSNWESEVLSERQIHYAANDAVVAVEIFFKLVASKINERKNRIETVEDNSSSSDLETATTKNAGGDIRDSNDGQSFSAFQIQNSASVKSKEVEISGKTETCHDEGVDQLCCSDLKSLKNNRIASSETEFVTAEDTFENQVSTFVERNNSHVIVSRANKNSDQTLPSTSDSDGTSSNTLEHSSANDGKITTFASNIKSTLGSLLSTSKVTEMNSNEKQPGRNYEQYESFKDLHVNEELLRSAEFWACLAPLCRGIVNVPYKAKAKHNGRREGEKSDKEKTGVSSRRAEKKSGLQPRRAPLYQNCVIEAPDGEMLSTCDKKKTEWYINKGLGKSVSSVKQFMVEA